MVLVARLALVGVGRPRPLPERVVDARAQDLRRVELELDDEALVAPQANRANKVYLARKENKEYVVCLGGWAPKAKREKLGVLGNKATWAPRACVGEKDYKV